MPLFGRKPEGDEQIPTLDETVQHLLAPIGPTEWEREPQPEGEVDYDQPTFRRKSYRPVLGNREEAKARLDNIGKEEMPLELVPQEQPAMLNPPQPASAVVWLTIGWLPGPPTVPGAYWIRHEDGKLGMAAVQEFGGRLCFVKRKGDSRSYTAVGVPHVRWAGPIALPVDVTLDELNDRLA